MNETRPTEKQLNALARTIAKSLPALRRVYGAHVAEHRIRQGAEHIEAMRRGR